MVRRMLASVERLETLSDQADDALCIKVGAKLSNRRDEKLSWLEQVRERTVGVTDCDRRCGGTGGNSVELRFGSGLTGFPHLFVTARTR